MVKLCVIVLAVLCLCGPAAVAQQPTKVNFLQDGYTGATPTPECNHAVAVARTMLAKFPHPADWTYVVACDEATWHHIHKAQRLPYYAEDCYGVTILNLKMVVLRGYTLTHVNPDAMPDHVVAHELCHVYLYSVDEDAVERLTLRWLRMYQ
jgi:hypothetical protein